MFAPTGDGYAILLFGLPILGALIVVVVIVASLWILYRVISRADRKQLGKYQRGFEVKLTPGTTPGLLEKKED